MPRRSWHQVAKRVNSNYRTSVDGDVFDSGAELTRWNSLKVAERGGLIRNLKRQVRYPLILPNGIPVKIRSPGFPNGRACSYHADFTYEQWHPKTKSWVAVTEEHKGHDDAASRLRRAIVEAIYGIEIMVTGSAAPRRLSRTQIKLPLEARP